MKTILKDLFGDLSPWGRLWLNFGVAALLAASWMSFMVGLNMTWAHAFFLVILSAVAAFLPVTAEMMWSQGRKIVSIVLAILAVPLLVVEFGQHAAYTAGIRGHDLATTRVQNVKHDGAQESVAENRRRLAWAEKRLSDLTQQNGWSSTVTADALRGRIPGLELAISQEAARGGCKQRCLERTKERDEIVARIAILEERTTLQKQIDGTKTMLDSSRANAATVEHKSSQTEHMNAFLSKAVSFVGQGQLKPNAHVEAGTQLSANLAMALAGTGLPSLALFVAGLYRNKRRDDDQPTPHVARETVNTTPTIPQPIVPLTRQEPTREMITLGRAAALLTNMKAAA